MRHHLWMIVPAAVACAVMAPARGWGQDSPTLDSPAVAHARLQADAAKTRARSAAGDAVRGEATRQVNGAIADQTDSRAGVPAGSRDGVPMTRAWQAALTQADRPHIRDWLSNRVLALILGSLWLLVLWRGSHTRKRVRRYLK